MQNKTGLLLLMLLILTNSSIAQQGDRLAPQATAAEVEAMADGSEAPFWDIPLLEKGFIDAAPTDRKDAISVGRLGVDGGNKEMIVKLAQEIADKKHGNFDSFLIAHKGKLLFESYYLRGRINHPHPQASATKVYTSLALGRAIQLGYLTMADLDKPLINFLKDLDPTKFVEGVEKITLHQAMTMRSGIRHSEEQREAFEKNPAPLKGQGQVQAYLEHTAPITAASQSFLYQGSDPNLVMQVIDAVVPGTAQDFIKKELLDKMDITTYGWGTNVSGLPQAGWRVSMTSRAMLKWGTLAMNKGKWNGEQLVPEAYIAKATHRIVRHSEDENFADHGNVTNTGYGFFWWQADMKVGNKSYFSTSSRGGGGQYVLLIEELDLIVVVTAHDGDIPTLQLTAERILPAFIQNAMPTLGGKSDGQDKSPVLEGPYLGQKLPGLTPEPFAPGLITTNGIEDGGVFTTAMDAFYFIRERQDTNKMEAVMYKQKNNRWHETVLLGKDAQPFYPCFAPDGKTMHLGKRYKERTDTGWSTVKSLGAPFEEINIMSLSSSLKGTYVIDERRPDDDGILRYSRLVDGKREAPKPFSKAINSGTRNSHPYIAPDESYMMWDGIKDSGFGSVDLYISFRQQDGSWGAAINMGDKINTDAYEAGAKVTPDGKYLFFVRVVTSTPEDPYADIDIFWVDAQIIETLRPKS
jgi:CubicO group peptidase (beta-lactamase class C family)